jgi:hypothetical protein
MSFRFHPKTLTRCLPELLYAGLLRRRRRCSTPVSSVAASTLTSSSSANASTPGTSAAALRHARLPSAHGYTPRFTPPSPHKYVMHFDQFRVTAEEYFDA